MSDKLGDRMKDHESRARIYLPRRTNTMIRLDGKAFHTYTKNCKKPFDDGLMEDMDCTAIALCEEIQGVKLGYVQSDEITLWLTDYDDVNTAAWFDGNIQKITSVSASIATSAFNAARISRFSSAIFNQTVNGHISDGMDKIKSRHSEALSYIIKNFGSASFDSRVWTLSSLTDVANTFLWRCQDASRNSVQMVARSLYSHSECENKNNSQLQEMIFAAGQNWNDLAPKYKRGRLIEKIQMPGTVVVAGETKAFMRNKWVVSDLQDHSFDYWSIIIENHLEYIS